MSRRSNRKAPAVAEPLESRRLLAASLVMNGFQNATPSAAVNLSLDSANGQSEMLIAVNPTNPLNIVGFSHRIPPNGTITLDVYRSTDGGATWSTTQITNANDGALGTGTTGNRYDPALAFDANGVLYIVYGYRGTTPDRLIAATSTDGGAIFGNFRLIDSQNGFTPSGAGAQPLPGVDRWTLTTGRVAGSNNQCAVIAYTQNVAEGNNNADQRIVVVGTQNGGVNWTAPLVINDGSNSGTDAGNIPASPAIGFDGDLHVTWYDGGTSIFIDHDRDGLFGNNFNFGAETAIRTNQGLVDIGNPPAIPGPPAQPDRGISVAPVLRASPFTPGELYVTFQERFGTSGNDTDIWFGRSTDYGVHWTFGGVPNGTGTEFHPMISIDPHSGLIGIAYYTTDGDQNTGNDDVRMQLAWTRDEGVSWGVANVSNQQSNETGGFAADYLEYTGLDIRDGTAHVLWASRYPAGGVDLDAFWSSISFKSSTNGNQLQVVGTPTGGNNNYVIRRSPANSQYLEVFTDGVRDYTGLIGSIDSIEIATNGGIDSFTLQNLPNIPVIIDGTVGNDTFNIDTLSGASSLTINGYAGDDTLTLGTGPNDFLTIKSPVTFNGGDDIDTLNIGSGFAQALDTDVTFNGGAGGNFIYFNDKNNTGAADYDVNGGVIRYDGGLAHNISYSNVNLIEFEAGSGGDVFNVHSNVLVPTIRAYGYGGNDTCLLGDGPALSGGRFFYGGDGPVDRMIIDTHSDTTGRVYNITPDSVDPPGWTASDLGVEHLTLLAGSGNDIFVTTPGTYPEDMTIDAGGGSDDVQLMGTLSNSITVRGGTDSVADSLEVDDRNLPANMSGGFVYADHIRRSVSWTGTSDIYYAGFSVVDWFQKDNQNLVSIYGVSADIGPNNQFSIEGGAADDYVEVYPLNAQGNPTILGNLYFNGAGGPDTLRVFTNTTAPANYRLFTQFGLNDVFIDGGGNHWMGATTTVENIAMYGGAGANSFEVQQFKSGAALSIFGGGTSNCRIGDGNLAANITNITAFTFDGQNGNATFVIDNGNVNNAWNYRINDPSIIASQSGGYFVSLVAKNIKMQQVLAGFAGDVFDVDAVEAGVNTELRSVVGLKWLRMGSTSGTVQTIRGKVTFLPGLSGGYMQIGNNADTTADTVHLTATTLGAFAGDNLFGPGGSLVFDNVVNGTGSDPGINLLLSSGANVVYAQPLASARVNISSHPFFVASSGSIKLGLAGVTNPVISGDASSGSVTSGNRQALSWSRFAGAIESDAVPPTMVGANINIDGIPGLPGAPEAAPPLGNQLSLDVRFSENVSGLLTPASLGLTNLTAGTPIPIANIAVAYDTGTDTAHFTFPGYPNGVLPDGNYHGRILAGLPDFYGNALAADAQFDFFFLNGDANRDRTVDFNDLVKLAQNYNSMTDAWSDGDFNFDAKVDFADLVILAQNYNRSLPSSSAALSSAAPALAASGSRVASRERDLSRRVFNHTTPIRRSAPESKVRRRAN
jgi:hypothetical protein